MPTVGLILYALGALALAWAQLRGHTWRFALKAVLSASFAAVALQGAFALNAVERAFAFGLGGAFATFMAGGLCLCAAGDMLFRRDGGRLSIGGAVMFGAAHVLITIAIGSMGLLETASTHGWVLLAAFCAVLTVFWWTVRTSTERGRVVAVLLYATLLGGMLMFAIGFGGWLMWPALAFVASDILLARHEFRRPKPWHLALCTPLYYTAQMAFALSIALVG